ncbi:Retrovirus-related Pol poly from transposon 297 [Solea senegalensis]|uniref:Retrovirus-related Pol poly from transposon 297 n=1 Tax=Solea senegalensis TaxID=28829 RepID=A0AAV6QDK5_SOLSE|nr:Retrovirus-related Pol poly from transposon 297 [Solea senegalensis]
MDKSVYVKREPEEDGVPAEAWRRTAGRGWLFRGVSRPAVGSSATRAVHDRSVQTAEAAALPALQQRVRMEPQERSPASAGGGGDSERVLEPSLSSPAWKLRYSPVQIQLPVYNGKTDWEAYRAQFELIAGRMEWSPSDMAFFLASKLSEDALMCITMLSPEERGDYGKLVAALSQRFGADMGPWTLQAELSGRHRRTGESLNALYGDIKTLTQRAYADMPLQVRSQMARDCFVGALYPPELRCAVQLAHPSSIEEALRLAVEREAVWSHARDQGGGANAVRAAREVRVPETKPEWVDDLTGLMRTLTTQGVSCLGVVDTGSSVTLVRPDLLPSGTPLQRTEVQLRTVTGLNVCYRVWVADIQDSCILGLDFMVDNGGVLDMGRGTLSFPGGCVTYRDRVDAPLQASPCPCGTSAVLPGPPVAAPVYLAPAAVPGLSVAPHHLSPHVQTFTPVAEASGVPGTFSSPVLDQCPSLGGGGQPTEEGRWGECGSDLNEQQRGQLYQLLGEFEECFAKCEGEVGRTHLATHMIETGEARPIKCHPRRLPLVRQEACHKAVTEMLEAGIIEPSDSPWASGVVMVPKKTGGWRLCADYRPLNKVTIKDSYPLPRIDESLDLISGSVWFSSLDLRSGYYQVPLAPESRPKTAFCTGRGLWQFKVMCFGLCNAPATFARLMDKVLADVPREQCLVYLDDILAHGGSFESALEALRRVLERIRAAGLKLHPDKCHFMKREVSFLGHRVTGEGISTMADKVGMVRNWPTPANRRQLKSFIGLASYYRRFVQGFATIAAPLHWLLEKDRSYGWTEACQAAFQHLQRALCEAPVLAPPSPSLAFVLDTDASSEGVGGVLSQVWPEGERVVAYFSKALEKPERNYCVTRRELLAVLRSV